ncbi:hypothetical protein IFM89_028830 [Coptis chinensis]|uniref:Uncharacterized protein n=1 Tax=Coptis chinensis TaxID=261450 RepID=A0A835LG19_9MAGN|nr:hypothetical protein IFM89_028830 [Coptis chinensis]
MKEKKNTADHVPSTSTTSPKVLKHIGMRVVRDQHKKSLQQHLILSRLRKDLLYSKLRSLIPSQEVKPSEAATELELEPYEIPAERDYDEEYFNPPNASNGFLTNIDRLENKRSNEDDKTSGYTVLFESEEDEEETLKPFVPSIKLDRMEGSILISTIVLKEVSLTSALFALLEEEKLDIVSENQYRTETKVAHTIQLNVPPGYNIDELERRLCIWARKPT